MEWTWHPVKMSFLAATAGTIITLSAAILIAHFMVKRRRRGEAILETILFLPLVLPPTVIGFILVVIFGSKSSVGRLIEYFTGSSVLFTALAAIIAASVVAFPLMYQSIKTGFLSVDSNILDAAEVDGASNWKQFIKIIIPLSTRSILTGIILGFTRGFGEFGATLMFAGNIPGKTQTIPTAIYLAIETGATRIAWYYALISIGFSFLLLLMVKLTGKQ
ncbi:molybdate transport system permease protein [Salinibacillus kushneri]|uniref:Molybdenum transport system permease n=1 Tax=Salinibacillus kushneri TaxID=237682 RepID=A0A1I0DL84_9BACI|nr:molybdate ABC transporter permease subunit [Salinibacillus kushneri]SET33259.1 molybdate transport system permease protein [Salinibacillus kushneri]